MMKTTCTNDHLAQIEKLMKKREKEKKNLCKKLNFDCDFLQLNKGLQY